MACLLQLLQPTVDNGLNYRIGGWQANAGVHQGLLVVLVGQEQLDGFLLHAQAKEVRGCVHDVALLLHLLGIDAAAVLPESEFRKKVTKEWSYYY